MKKSYLIAGVVVIIVIAALFGIISYTKYKNETKDYNEKTELKNSFSGKQNQNEENHDNENKNYYNAEARGCKGSGPVKFTVSPRKIEDIGMFAPMGLMLGDHVTPIDHGYFYPPN